MQNKRSHIKFSYSARVAKEIEIYEGILVEYDVNGSIIGLQIDNSIEKTLLPKLKAIFRSEGFNGNNKQQFQTTKKFIERLLVEDILIDKALKQAMRKAATLHKKLGHRAYGSKDGILYSIPPEEIEIPETDEEADS
ncbi:MAG: hypothetical protein ACQETH_15890 [Candidatus Rifleibacteriota bacterium]|jgi:uncharacterized protein YuzE